MKLFVVTYIILSEIKMLTFFSLTFVTNHFYNHLKIIISTPIDVILYNIKKILHRRTAKSASSVKECLF